MRETKKRMKLRKNPSVSSCGLFCDVCSMKISGHCNGCHVEGTSQKCKISRCCLEHDYEFCGDCHLFPCACLNEFQQVDSFISHQHILKNSKRLHQNQEEVVNEVRQRKEIAETLLTHYNQHRHKSFYLQAVHLLPLADLQEVVQKIQSEEELVLSLKEVAEKRQINLKKRSKKNESSNKHERKGVNE